MGNLPDDHNPAMKEEKKKEKHRNVREDYIKANAEKVKNRKQEQ